MSQTEKILKLLKRGKKLTALTALRAGMGLRLGARVHELRQQGYAVQSRLVKRGKAHVAEYSL